MCCGEKVESGGRNLELIKRQLQAKEIPFELIYHDQPMLQSAEEGAAHFGIELRQTAPALILRIDQGYHALIVSGGPGPG